MRQLLFLVSFASICVLSACGGAGGKSGKPVKYQIPWPKADHSGYQIQAVTLKTLTDPYRLKGSAAKVLFEPRSDDQFERNKARLRYIENGDVLVPADTATLQMTVVYAHHEKFLEMDEAVGVVKDLKRPRKIGVNVKLVRDRSEEEHLETDNALYFPKTDSILIVPYTKGDVPLTVNAGVLAHEYFHGLFQSLIYNRLEQSKLAVGGAAVNPTVKPTASEDSSAARTVSAGEFNDLVLRAMNEGLADFWAWVYLGDDDFMSHSLPKNAKNRRLDEAAAALPGVEELKRAVAGLSEGKMISLAYRLGTNYARFFRNLAVSEELADSREKRIEVARRMVQTLREFGRRLEAAESEKWISPHEFIEAFASDHAEVSQRRCAEFQKILAHAAFKGCR